MIMVIKITFSYIHVISEYEKNKEAEIMELKPANARALSEFKTGEAGKVVRITAKNPVRRRILEMGVTPGTDICVRGMAPLGDPMEILVKGYHLSLRKGEAAGILVEVAKL